MNFAVIFLKMLALYKLWRAQFLTELHAVFCVHQIWILLPLQAKNLDQKVSGKYQKNLFKIGYNLGYDISSYGTNMVTKNEISPQRKHGSLPNFRLLLIRHILITKFFFVKIRARTRAQMAKTRAHTFTHCARAYVHGSLRKKIW